MNTLIHADAFFFIATIGFVILFILLAIALVYLIRLFRSVTTITKGLEANALAIGDDAQALVADIRDSSIFSLIFGRRTRRKGVATKEKRV